MENDPRIASLSITSTLPRQTPRNEFGAVFARTAQEAVRAGSGLAGGMGMSPPVVSAAVSSVRSTVSLATSVTGGGAALPGVGGTAGKGEAWDLLEAQKLMAAEGQKFNLEYLQLQNAMQQESREHNAVSNIMKVRHDSAKAAINNIR
ncbi:hypothetical protein SAMN05444354_106281 [Stigmatella aurantiaca]|uniref:Uncharacterized protein n=1 Tax=Stigmatella aurantiaca TaxID=41 RepID=A0A1H7QUL8_STIAU|nr:hypothetical protein [Stigmatella aurantiaca]SEL51690.1 hypothetical protein SAMN05444354_106281 [Stigmatella aurantiaca]